MFLPIFIQSVRCYLGLTPKGYLSLCHLGDLKVRELSVSAVGPKSLNKRVHYNYNYVKGFWGFGEIGRAHV